ncbi:MAG: VanZ family protein [Desulfobacteraceae bacterium]|nr:VanZ family protein [Desulfobacteraceae bacterium]
MSRKLIFFVLFGSIVYFSLVPEYFGNDLSLPDIVIIKYGFLQHVLGYFLLGWIMFHSFNKNRIWYYLAGLIMVGILLESLQGIIPSRAFNIYDILSNCIGIFVVALIVFLKKGEFNPNE